MSDPKEPNRYEPLKEIQREAEAKAKAERAQRHLEENFESERDRYIRFQQSEVKSNKITHADMRHNVIAFETDMGFAKRAAQQMDAQNFERPKQEREGTEADHKAASMEMTEARSVRLKRLKEHTAQIATERKQNEKGQDKPARDQGDRSR